jgi:hypothetical protein
LIVLGLAAIGYLIYRAVQNDDSNDDEDRPT